MVHNSLNGPSSTYRHQRLKFGRFSIQSEISFSYAVYVDVIAGFDFYDLKDFLHNNDIDLIFFKSSCRALDRI